MLSQTSPKVHLTLLSRLPSRSLTISVVRILHEHGWVHRDLSYGNVLVDAAGGARLIDFEFAKKYASKEDPEFRVVRTSYGVDDAPIC